MSNISPRGSKSIGSAFLLLLVLVNFVCPVIAADEVFTDTSIQTQDEKTLMLFPAHEIQEFLLQKPAPDIIFLDLPRFTLPGGTKIVLSPSPKIKFSRISQISTLPPVVRVALIFNKESLFSPKIIRNRLYLEESPQTASANGSPRIPTSANQQQEPIDVTPAIDRAAQTSNSYQSQQPANILDTRVSLQFEREDLANILNALAVKLNLRIFADAGVKGKFTVNAQDVPLRDILKNLLLQKSFQYTLKGRDLTIISLGQGTDRVARELLFKDLSLRDALQTLSKMMNVNLIIHDSVQDKKVNFYIENLSLDELLELLISTNDLVQKPFNENTFVIMNKTEAKKFGEKQYRTFKLVNSKPSEIISVINGCKPLAEKVDTTSFAVNERINAFSVYETAENLDLIAKVISTNDEKLQQAVIELKLLEINRSSLKQLGITLDSYSIRTADIGRLPSKIAIGATLELLEQENKAKVLASPKIRAVHGKKAAINIGEVIPVPFFRYEVASSTYLGYTPQTFKEYRDVMVGINLEVTPEISRDNEISLELNTSVNSVLDINSDGQIHKSERRTNTYVRIKDGETVVLGGLISQNDAINKQSPSMLNKVPLLRGLLSQSKFDARDSEMIILVTPHLVNLDNYTAPDSAKPGIVIEKHEPSET